MKPEALDSVKDQIGSCGIWCGSCVLGNRALKELTMRYKELAERYGLEEWAPKDFDYEGFKKELTSVQEASFCSGCMKGGGRTDCEMRSCASGKKIAGCGECAEFTECKNFGLLQKMRKGARDAGLLVKDRNVDRQEFIVKGMEELRRRFPSCILLCDKR